MPIRWVISPVVVHGGCFSPKVMTLIDIGRTPILNPEFPTEGPEFLPLRFSTANTYQSVPPTLGSPCLSFVRGKDFTTIDADPDCVTLFEDDYEDDDNLLDKTAVERTWDANKIARIKKRLTDRGVDSRSLRDTAPLREWLQELGRRINPERGERVDKNYVRQPRTFS